MKQSNSAIAIKFILFTLKVMRLRLLFISFFLLCSILFSISLHAATSDFAEFRKPNIRVFLLANQDYEGKDLDLRYAINDMLVFKKLFQNVFDVPESKIFLHNNLTISDFLKSSKVFSDSVEARDLVVIVYAGHGNVNGMPIFTDRQTIAPSKFFAFLNAFSNDTVLIMDSCYSGAEGSSVLTADEIDSATIGLPELVVSKDIDEGLGYRSNILRIYSSLAHQQSREAKYKGVKRLSKHLDRTYSFLEGLGYEGEGNGIFSIIFASFFAELDFASRNYTYDSLNSYINLKVSALKESGYSSQRPKLVPIGSPFKSKENYYILYKDFSTKEPDKLDKRYMEAVVEQSKGNYELAISHYEAIYKDDKSYKDVGIRMSDSYLSIAQTYEDKDIDKHLFFLDKALEYNPKSLFVLNALGRAYISRGLYDKSLSMFSNLLNLSLSYNEHFFISHAHNNIGFIYYTRGILDLSLEHFELGLDASKKIDDFSGQALANNYIGALYLKIGYQDKALSSFEETKRISELSGDKFSLASALNNIALIEVSKGDYESALSNFLEVLSHFKSLSASDELIICQNNIGFTYTSLEEYDKALEYYNRSLSLYRSRGDLKGEVAVTLSIADVYYNKGSYSTSLEFLSGLKEIIQEDDVPGMIKLYVAMGLSYMGMKNYKKGLDLFKEAKFLAKYNDYVDLDVFVSVELSVLYESLIKESISKEVYEDALKYLEEVLAIYLGFDSSSSLVGQTYASIGYVHYKQGNYVKALSSLDKALPLTSGNEDVKKSVLSSMANILLAFGIDSADEGEYSEAFKHFNHSLEISRSLKDYFSAAKTATTISSFYEKLGRDEKVIDYYLLALDLFTEANDLINIADTYHRIGLYYNSTEDDENAYNNFRQAFLYINGYEDKPLYDIIAKDLVYITNVLASNSYKKKRYNLASIYYEEAFNFLEGFSLNDDKLLYSILKGLSLSYWNINKYEDAVLYQKRLLLVLEKIDSPELKGERDILKIMLEKIK